MVRMTMKLTCDLILSRSKGPKERGTRRFTSQNREAGTSAASGSPRHGRPYVPYLRSGAGVKRSSSGRELHPLKSSAFSRRTLSTTIGSTVLLAGMIAP